MSIKALEFYKANVVSAKNAHTTWQLIETAPKGGRVLVTGTEIGPCVASQEWKNGAPDGNRWGVVNDIFVHPTHWQPLPQPPKKTDVSDTDVVDIKTK